MVRSNVELHRAVSELGWWATYGLGPVVLRTYGLTVLVALVVACGEDGSPGSGVCAARQGLFGGEAPDAVASSLVLSSVRVLRVDAATGVLTGVCSGVAIGENQVLTAQHCVDQEAGEELSVVTGIGRATRSDQDVVCGDDVLAREDVTLGAGSKYVHQDADLAVLAVEGGLEHWLPTSQVSASEPRSGVGEYVTLGYGLTEESTIGALRSLSVDVIYVESGEIWVGSPTGAPCLGDSGGGLFRTSDAPPSLIGILAGGTEDCEGPDRYMDLSAVSEWLVAVASAL